jgi:hypothetical protein
MDVLRERYSKVTATVQTTSSRGASRPGDIERLPRQIVVGFDFDNEEKGSSTWKEHAFVIF